MAILYKGIIYAWEDKNTILNTCSDRLISSIDFCPLTRDTVINIGAFKELLLKTITKIIATELNLCCTKNKIWDNKEYFKRNVGNKTILTYYGVKLALIFDNKYSYITFTPSYAYDDNIVLTKLEKSNLRIYSMMH